MQARRRGPALEVVLGRQEKLHAMDATAWSELRKTLGRAEADEEVRAVIVRGDARAFCAGNDIAAMVQAADRGEAEDYFVDGMLPTFVALATTPVPVISVVEGLALGGGVELLVFSDLVIATRNATFGLPETRVGVWPTVFVAASGPAHVRRAGARLALTGEPVDADTALALGVVTHVCDPAALESMIDDVITAIAIGDRDATARTKAWLNRDLVESGLPRSREALLELCEDTLRGPGYREAMAAFTARKERTRRGEENR